MITYFQPQNYKKEYHNLQKIKEYVLFLLKIQTVSHRSPDMIILAIQLDFSNKNYFLFGTPPDLQ